MTINQYILLCLGSFFALLYAVVITFGWALTRRNRRIIQQTNGRSRVPTMILDCSINDVPASVETISLTKNKFIDSDGTAINTADYEPYIAIGSSKEFPYINNGDLILKDKSGEIRYVFALPDIKRYR